MKTVGKLLCTVVLVVFIFFPWLLRLLDLASIILVGDRFTSRNWWGAVWAEGDYFIWPFYAVVICIVSGLIWTGMELCQDQTSSNDDVTGLAPRKDNE